MSGNCGNGQFILWMEMDSFAFESKWTVCESNGQFTGVKMGNRQPPPGGGGGGERGGGGMKKKRFAFARGLSFARTH